MQVKTLISIIALGTALAFAGPASAQSMTINGNAVSADDLPKVQARCDELANTASTESITDDTGDDKIGDGATATDATVGTTPQVNEAEAATAQSVDLDAVTQEACATGGFTKSAM